MLLDQGQADAQADRVDRYLAPSMTISLFPWHGKDFIATDMLISERLIGVYHGWSMNSTDLIYCYQRRIFRVFWTIVPSISQAWQIYL